MATDPFNQQRFNAACAQLRDWLVAYPLLANDYQAMANQDPFKDHFELQMAVASMVNASRSGRSIGAANFTVNIVGGILTPTPTCFPQLEDPWWGLFSVDVLFDPNDAIGQGQYSCEAPPPGVSLPISERQIWLAAVHPGVAEFEMAGSGTRTLMDPLQGVITQEEEIGTLLLQAVVG